MIARAITAADLDRVLEWTVTEPLNWVDADEYRAEMAQNRYRPEWTWIVEDDAEQILARAVWWGRDDSDQPQVLDCLSVARTVTDPAPLAAQLLDGAHTAFGTRPLFQLKLTTGWSEDPVASAAVAWRKEAASTAGLTHAVERLQFEWTPADGLPDPRGRLTFKPESDDAAMLDVFLRIAAGSLDAETRKHVAALGAEEAARNEMAYYLDAQGERDWWRLAYTEDGQLAGLAIPSATPYGVNVGYLGVLPEMRGKGYVDDILGEITRSQAGRGATRVTATTDAGNAPMAAAFLRGGYRIIEVRIAMSAS